MKNKRLLLIFCTALLTAGISFSAFAQSTGGTGNGGSPVRDLPMGFHGINLGMSMEEVKTLLKGDAYFHFRGDPDVSMLPAPNMNLIECTGVQFIDRAFFQFFDNKLYSIILNLNKHEIDYFTMHTALKQKYGESKSLDPQQIIWENNSVRLSLERPLTVKYIDLPALKRMRDEAQAKESYKAVTRKQFLDEF